MRATAYTLTGRAVGRILSFEGSKKYEVQRLAILVLVYKSDCVSSMPGYSVCKVRTAPRHEYITCLFSLVITSQSTPSHFSLIFYTTTRSPPWIACLFTKHFFLTVQLFLTVIKRTTWQNFRNIGYIGLPRWRALSQRQCLAFCVRSICFDSSKLGHGSVFPWS